MAVSEEKSDEDKYNKYDIQDKKQHAVLCKQL